MVLFILQAAASTAVVLGPAAKIIAIAAGVSLFIQGIKKYILPGLDGKVALAFNFIAAMVTALSLANPGQISSLDYWIQLVTSVGLSVLATAGVHDLASFTKLFKQNGAK